MNGVKNMQALEPGGRIRARKSSGCDSSPTTSASAFTLLELLVVIAVIAILAAILLPALSRAKQKAQGVYCMNNGKQLMLALHIYADDNNEWLPPNEYTGYRISPDNLTPNWVIGDIRTADATNLQYLADPKYAKLASYTGRQARLYKCPGDKHTWTDPGGHAWPRVRTYAMNEAVGTMAFELMPTDGAGLTWPNRWNAPNNPYCTYGRFRDMLKPGPSDLFVFLDQDNFGSSPNVAVYPPESPNTASFYLSMLRPTYMRSWPGNYHSLGCMFTYADGHAQIHRWKDSRTYAYIQDAMINDYPNGSLLQTNPDNPDILWMQEHTSASYQP